jgi:hypothetical protein
VRRRLQRLGAVALKNSVYVLPDHEDALEDFHWLLGEIQAEGGDATLCRATLLGGATDQDIEELFRVGCDAAYREIEEMSRAGETEPERLRQRFEEVCRMDLFNAGGREHAEAALRAAEQMPSAEAATRAQRGRGLTWVTRAGVKVDRMASAWLIRRFIDPEARFRFAAGKRSPRGVGEVRFDMFQGEYTHDGDRCTFEVLLHRFGLDDPALRAIGEIVHDIDLKDEKFRRPETQGISAIIEGIALSRADDSERLAQGAAMFEGLYARLNRPAGV